MLDEKAIAALAAGAERARQSAYAPYSNYKVGAAVLADDERVYFGCNVENASYGLSLCAERSAIAAAVAGGAKRIMAVVVLTEATPPGTPCGACRQWLAEFGSDDMPVIAVNASGDTQRFTLGRLLPDAFRLGRDGDRG
jgi:cytidine deaminase